MFRGWTMDPNEEVIRAFSADIIEMMEEHFNETVSIIRDPETEEETLHKVSGDDISESEYYALLYFELGWNAALRSFERMGASYLDSAIEKSFLDEGETEYGHNDGEPD